MSELPIDLIDEWIDHPAQFVRDFFEVEPDAWQVEALEAFPTTKRISMQACKGPGKTTVLVWLNWYFLATRPACKAGVCANDAKQLRDGFWTDMATWQSKNEYLRTNFTITNDTIYKNSNPEGHWLSLRTWAASASPEQAASSLAGIHHDHCLMTLDESGSMPLAVLKQAEGIFTGDTDQHVLQAGNPNEIGTPLFHAATKARKDWFRIEITGDPDDPKRSPRVAKQWAQSMIDQHGRDNAWVLSNVFGKFPPVGGNALLSLAEVEAAIGRHLARSDYYWAPMRLGVDVARFGDDASVIFPRQGRCAMKPTFLRNVDSIQGAGHTAQVYENLKGRAIMVDATGGYGVGWIDQLRSLGYTVLEVQFAGKPFDPRYANKRTEMWFAMCEWIKSGGSLPSECPDIVDELCSATYKFKGDKLILEDKDEMKARLGRSPDYADALACTFAYEIAADDIRGQMPFGINLRGDIGKSEIEYDPWNRD